MTCRAAGLLKFQKHFLSLTVFKIYCSVMYEIRAFCWNCVVLIILKVCCTTFKVRSSELCHYEIYFK